MMDRSMIDAASGGALMDKTPIIARHLISNMARPSQSRMVNEIGAASNLRLENQLFKLTSLVRQLAVGQHQPSMAAKVCGICTFAEQPTNLCPTLQEAELDQPESVRAIGGYQYGKQPYQSQPFDNQQFGKQPFQPRLCRGPYIVTECASRTSRLSTIKSTMTSTIVQTVATIENATLRKFSISRGPDEATCSQQFGVSAIHELQQHAIQQPSLINNSESERERKCNLIEKWKRTISANTAAAVIN
ncbi:hypothetical protein CR513_19032, partial [Mucuna pruriens]